MNDISLARADALKIGNVKTKEVKVGKEKKSVNHLAAIKIIFFVLLGLLVLELLVYKIVLPGLGRPNIRFVGSKTHTDTELMQMIGQLANESWFLFDSERTENVLASVPAIAYANVSKSFPNNVMISITEREPVAMTFLNNGGRSIPVEIDKNGILFEQRTARSESIPIISGLPVESLANGMRIPSKYRTLIEQIAHISSLPQHYFAALSEICVMPKEYGTYELLLIPAYSRTKVLTDRALNEDALQYMMVVLDVVNSIEPNVAEIDLRYGSVSYRTR